MYNHTVKTMFLDGITRASLVSEYIDIFRLSEPIEQTCGIDLCQFNSDSMRLLFNGISVDYFNRERVQNLLVKYFDFCIKIGASSTHPPVDEAFIHIPSESVYKYVSGPSGLQKYLNSIYAPEKLETVDNIYRSIYWLVFAGANESCIETVTTNDVNTERLVFTINESDYPIYREGLPAIQNCKLLPAFNLIRTDYCTKLMRVDGDLLLRGVKANPSVARMRVEILRRSKQGVLAGHQGAHLTLSSTRRSGIFYRAYNIEMSLRPQIINPKQVITEEMVKAGLVDPFKTTIDTYIAEYRDWKRAFC